MSSNLQNPEDNHHDEHPTQQVGLDGPRLKDGTPMNRGSFSIPRSHKIPATKENQQQEKQDSDLQECLYTIQDMQEMEEQIYLSAQKNAREALDKAVQQAVAITVAKVEELKKENLILKKVIMGAIQYEDNFGQQGKDAFLEDV